jgi:hypothetical protein
MQSKRHYSQLFSAFLQIPMPLQPEGILCSNGMDSPSGLYESRGGAIITFANHLNLHTTVANCLLWVALHRAAFEASVFAWLAHALCVAHVPPCCLVLSASIAESQKRIQSHRAGAPAISDGSLAHICGVALRYGLVSGRRSI